jgi:hypothetical protein
MTASLSYRQAALGKAILLLILFLLPGRLRGNELYFMVVFGAQREAYRPRFTHTFATFVKVTGNEAVPSGFQIESHTISWMPSTLDIKVHRLFPECGTNLELDTTLRWASSNCLRISMWGPFQIDRELYDLALCRIGHLQSGQVSYKAADSGYPAATVSNCTHAVSDIAGTFALRTVTPGYGDVASYTIIHRLKRWIVDPQHVHDWLNEPLRLNCYPIVHRDFRGFNLLKFVMN